MYIQQVMPMLPWLLLGSVWFSSAFCFLSHLLADHRDLRIFLPGDLVLRVRLLVCLFMNTGELLFLKVSEDGSPHPSAKALDSKQVCTGLQISQPLVHSNCNPTNCYECSAKNLYIVHIYIYNMPSSKKISILCQPYFGRIGVKLVGFKRGDLLSTLDHVDHMQTAEIVSTH